MCLGLGCFLFLFPFLFPLLSSSLSCFFVLFCFLSFSSLPGSIKEEREEQGREPQRERPALQPEALGESRALAKTTRKKGSDFLDPGRAAAKVEAARGWPGGRVSPRVQCWVEKGSQEGLR